jgi:hypothetical protein
MKSALFFTAHNDRIAAYRFTETFSAMCAAGNQLGIIAIAHCASHACQDGLRTHLRQRDCA